MTQEDLKNLVENHEDDFRNYLNDWHGHHTQEHMEENFDQSEGCKIHELLNQPEDCTVKELVDAFEDEDGDWGSWELYLQHKKLV